MCVGSVKPITMEQLVVKTKEDEELKELANHIQSGRPARTLGANLASYKRVYDELSVCQNGVVLRNKRLVVPSGLREMVMKFAHIGHQGEVKTKAIIRSRVWFPSIDRRVEEAMRRCLACQVNCGKQVL